MPRATAPGFHAEAKEDEEVGGSEMDVGVADEPGDVQRSEDDGGAAEEPMEVEGPSGCGPALGEPGAEEQAGEDRRRDQGPRDEARGAARGTTTSGCSSQRRLEVGGGVAAFRRP